MRRAFSIVLEEREKALFRISVNQIDFYNAKEKQVLVTEDGEVIEEKKAK